MMKKIESAMIGEVSYISVAEALKDEKWKNAMKDGYKSLIEMKTWGFTEKPKDVKPFACRWVLCEMENTRQDLSSEDLSKKKVETTLKFLVLLLDTCPFA